MEQGRNIQLGTTRLRVPSLVSLSGLRIQRCHELWCRSQTRLRSGIAVATAWADSYSSNQTLSLGTSICHGCGPKKKKERNFRSKSSQYFYDQKISYTKWFNMFVVDRMILQPIPVRSSTSSSCLGLQSLTFACVLLLDP